MLYLIFGIGIFFLLMAFLLNEKNASYLLSGYNTMSEEEKANFDLLNYLKTFKRFHIFLGASFMVLGLAILYMLGADAAGIFLGLYPIIAYIWLILESRKYYLDPQKARKNNIAAIVLGLTLLGVGGLFFYGYQENQIRVEEDRLVISGMYGLEMEGDQIESLELIEELPALSIRINGFSTGRIKKGYYKTESGERIRLLINSAERPILMIVPKSGPVIFYTPASGQELAFSFEELQALLLSPSA
ncbi:MAG: DUF3784 domain-containing protein [Bacteroidetes bacterium]|nr:DUF3784 domain-containing protein [Bacteroidota bacterium]